MRKFFLAALVLAASGPLATASPILAGFVQPNTGDVHVSGTSIVGSNFEVGGMLGLNTPLHNNVSTSLFNSVGGSGVLHGNGNLNFATASFLSEHSVGHVDVFEFAKGGSFSLVGGANLEHLGHYHAGDIPAGSTLVSGQFNSKVTVRINTRTGLGVLEGSTADTVNPALAAYYGVTGPYGGYLQMAFKIKPDGDGKLDSGDIHFLGGTFLVIASAPEPGTFTLLLTGLLGGGIFCGWRRRGSIAAV